MVEARLSFPIDYESGEFQDPVSWICILIVLTLWQSLGLLEAIRSAVSQKLPQDLWKLDEQ